MRTLFVAAVCPFAAAACTSDPAAGACTGAGTGTLSLTVDVGATTGARPDRMPAAVVFDAEGAEVGRAASTTAFDGLPGGMYTIEAWRGEGDPAGKLTGWATGVAGQPVTEVCVGDDVATEVSLAWAALTSAEHLWVTSGEAIAAFGADQIDAGGDQQADILLQASLINDFRGLAFDRMGTLWAATAATYGTRLVWWTPDRLVGRGAAEPSGELTSALFGYTSIGDLAFTDDGTLWVELTSGPWHGLYGFSRATLDRAVLDGGADVEPDFQRAIDPVAGDADLEIAPDGAMWVADFWGDALYRIDDPMDGGSGVDASVDVYAPEGTAPLSGAQNVAFDSDGNAVVFFWTGTEIAWLPAADIAGDGELVLTEAPGSGTVTDLGNGLVVDGADRSWLGNYTGTEAGQILGWTPGAAELVAQLQSADITDPADLVLDPRPR